MATTARRPPRRPSRRSARVVPPPEGDATGLRAYVTGEAGFEADRSAAVEGHRRDAAARHRRRPAGPAAGHLPLAARGARPARGRRASPTSWPPASTYGLVAAGLTSISGQTSAILIVLMFGAGTDYCLLIVARYRDELRRSGDVHAAMARAAERTGPAILSAGAIVVVAMLALGLADFNATREMGPILALGVAVMVAAGLTLLPAMLAALGRRAFWPAMPRPSRGPRPAAGLARRSPGVVRAAPAPIAGGRHRRARRGRAGQPRRPRAARLHRGVPRPAGVRARRRR